MITIKPFEHVAPGRYQIEIQRKTHSGTGSDLVTYYIVVVILGAGPDDEGTKGGGAKRKRDMQKNAHINVHSGDMCTRS